MIDVAVVGSLHLDIMVAAPRLPLRDETLMGSSWRQKCGGKGGNQAVAAARFAARTAFGGQTGDDDFGRRLRDNLKSAGVGIQCVATDPARGSGMSVAIEEAEGEYAAVAVSGANASIDAATAAAAWAPLWSCKVLLLQNEIPEAVNIAAAKAVKASAACVLLNAAPARTLASELLDLVDVLIVNRVEAAMLAGCPAETPDEAELAASALSAGLRHVVVTLGGDGLVLQEKGGGVSRIAALPVALRSSHGAGDCVCGALAARLAQGDSIATACAFANAAAALFVSTPEESQAAVDSAAVLQRMRSRF